MTMFKVLQPWGLRLDKMGLYDAFAGGVTPQQEAPGHRGPAKEPEQPAAPGGNHVRGAPVRAGGVGIWCWHVFWRVVWLGTRGTPWHGRVASSHFLLLFPEHLRYI